ncbi:FecCD family ABC transporter permease [Actinokineospora sp. G85]|uniref:FecCD family ABC transporter permease n=1 Tax=Actinokineospora sp. G85 TaxID=3406626 RepID=UPI003C76876B
MGLIERSAAQTTFRVGDRGPSGVVRTRVLAVLACLAALVFLAFAAGLAFGDYPMSLGDAAAALFWYGDPTTVDIVYSLRLPRVLVGLLVGLAFGASGAVFQTLARNPLASPDVIGVAEGANTAAVAGLVLGFGSVLGASTTALLGAAASATLVYLLAWKNGTTGYRIVLVGIGVSALFTSVTAYFLQRADVFQAQRAVLWLTGSLNLREWRHVWPLLAAVVVLLPAVLLMARWLGGLALGDDTATGLGVPVQRARLALMLAGVGLVAFATSAAGPVAFVALVSPQIALRLVRRPTPPLLTSALTGALVVLAGDLVARWAGLPVGVVTGAVGAPYLLWLLSRAKRVGG